MKCLFLLLLATAYLPAETFTYWIEPCTNPAAECEQGDDQIAQWAMKAWENASKGTLTFERSPFSKARIRLYWAHDGSQGLYGEARAIEVHGRSGAEVHIRSDLHALGHRVEGVGSKDRLFRHTIVYLTVLHETGHALGLEHSKSFHDIMYSFEYGGNILDYFGRYRRTLNVREDIATHPGLSNEDKKRLLALYAKKPGVTSAVSAESATRRK